MFGKKFTPEEVFTPKGSTVNKEMYIDRPVLETALEKAIKKPKHIIIHGESGSGKTWLYKNLFRNKNIHYEVLNAATIITAGSISNAIKLTLNKLNPIKNTGYNEKMTAKASVVVFDGSLDHTEKYEYQLADPFFELVKLISNCSDNTTSFVVIDNIEHILNNENHVRELSALLLYLDDERYSEFNVRILLVGTPANIRDYFSTLDNGQTIVNRVQEIPEVSVLTDSQTKILVNRGLFEYLKYKVQESRLTIDGKQRKYSIDRLYSDVSWYSANIPQYVHELCLEVSLNAQKNDGLISENLFYDSLFEWLNGSLISEHSRLEQNVNSVETKHGRRNQVIYAISNISLNEFNYQDIEAEVRRAFPTSTEGKTLNVSGVLSELSTGQFPLIRKVPKGTRYRFIDPRIKIISRWMLKKKDDNGEALIIQTFDENIKLF